MNIDLEDIIMIILEEIDLKKENLNQLFNREKIPKNQVQSLLRVV